MRVLPGWRRAQRHTPSPAAVPLKVVPAMVHTPSHQMHTKFSANFDSRRKVRLVFFLSECLHIRMKLFELNGGGSNLLQL